MPTPLLSRDKRVGQKSKTNEGYEIEIIDYKNSLDYTVNITD